MANLNSDWDVEGVGDDPLDMEGFVDGVQSYSYVGVEESEELEFDFELEEC